MDHVADVARIEADARQVANQLAAFRSALSSQGIVVVSDAEGRCVFANDGFCALTGYSREELAADFAKVMLMPERRPEAPGQAVDRSAAELGKVEIHTKDGDIRWVAVTCVPLLDGEGRVEQLVNICHDITVRVAAEHAASRRLEVSELISRMWSERISSGSAYSSITYTIRGLLQLFGGQSACVWQVGRDEHGAATASLLCRAATEQKVAERSQPGFEIIGQTRLSQQHLRLIEEACATGLGSGLLVPICVGVELMGVLVLDETGGMRDENQDDWESIVGAIGELLLAQRDADRRLESEAYASRLARQDVLTGLANRRTLIEAFEGRIDHPDAKFGLLMIDLDRFKPINDSHGHHIGDRVLQVVAQRLRGAADGDCEIIRLGGDEFAILTSPNGHPPHNVRDEVAAIAARVLEALKNPLAIGGLSLTVSASIGVAMYPSDATDVQRLLCFADASMYRAKQRRGEFQFFDASIDDVIQTRAALEVELRAALADGEIVPFYQPIVSLETGELVGHEMLARWRHKTRGDVGPTIFIPIAENAGLIDALFWNLLHAACAAHVKAGCTTPLSVNLSPAQIGDPLLAQKIIQALTMAGFAPSRLQVEVTESDVIKDSDKARAVLLSLKSQGVRIALDDFGTGYSSLLVLRDLPSDTLKIDRSFVSGLAAGADADIKIIDAVLAMASALNIETTAEGIETEAVAALLRAKGCDHGQGFLYGAAQPSFSLDAQAQPARLLASG